MQKIFKKIFIGIAILVLIFLAIGLYNLEFLEKEKEKAFRESISNLCEHYKTFKGEISCQEALNLVLTEYPDAIVSSMKPFPSVPNNPNRWLVDLKLSDPEGNKTPIEVFITKDKDIVPK